MLALVATNFSLVAGYLAFAAVPPWNVKSLVLFSVAVFAALYCWYVTSRTHRKQRVSPPPSISDDKLESNGLTPRN